MNKGPNRILYDVKENLKWVSSNDDIPLSKK